MLCADVPDAPAQPAVRGCVFSGMLNLSCNLGLITGASAVGAVFAPASGTSDITTAPLAAVATGTQVTFAVAAILIAVALAAAVGVYRRPWRNDLIKQAAAHGGLAP